MGKVQELTPRHKERDQSVSDTISNAQIELDMLRGAVRLALYMSGKDNLGPEPDDVHNFLELINCHLETLNDLLNGAQHGLND